MLLNSVGLFISYQRAVSLVHTYVLPTKYQTKVNDRLFSCSETPEEPEERPDQYNVSVDWILEAAQYNEWLNEEDFEVLENGKVKVRLQYRLKYFSIAS